MSIDELAKERTVTYESFVEFLKKQWGYPVDEEIAEEVYNEYIDHQKSYKTSFDSLEYRKRTLFHFSVIIKIQTFHSSADTGNHINNLIERSHTFYLL